MTDYQGIALIIAALATAMATLATSIGGLIVALRTSNKVEEVHQATNGMSRRLEQQARDAGNVEGRAELKAEQKE